MHERTRAPSATVAPRGIRAAARACPHVTTAAQRQLAVEHWLLAAAPDRAVARTEWDDWHVALLSCGTIFSAVRTPASVVQAAARSTDPVVIDAYLVAALLEGPVICDRYADWYYVLVPASTAARWDVSSTVCLGRQSSLGVPRPGCTGADGVRVYWSVPMDSPAMLCSPQAVAQLVAAGRWSLARPGPRPTGLVKGTRAQRRK